MKGTNYRHLIEYLVLAVCLVVGYEIDVIAGLQAFQKSDVQEIARVSV